MGSKAKQRARPWAVVQGIGTRGAAIRFRGSSLAEVYDWMRARYTSPEEMWRGVAITKHGSLKWLGPRPARARAAAR